MRQVSTAGAAAAPAQHLLFQSTFDLVRPDDQLALVVHLGNLTAAAGPGGFQLVAVATGQAGFVRLDFPSQQLLEYAAEGSGTRPLQPEPIFTGTSRLVFVVPPGSPPIPFTVAGILGALPSLAIAGGAAGFSIPEAAAITVNGDVLDRRLAALAARAGIDRAREAAKALERELPEPAPAAAAEPAPLPSQINLPYRLELALPGGATRFLHAARPVDRDGRVEPWHTRLVVRATDGSLVQQPVPVLPRTRNVAFAPPDPAWQRDVTDALINSALSAADCVNLNTQSSKGRTASARRLVLSNQGATLDVRAKYPDGNPRAWRHRTVMGRDAEVRTTVAGTLFPLGHDAELVRTTTRGFDGDVNGSRAGLRTRSIIRVKEPEQSFNAFGDEFARRWPWRVVEILTDETPARGKLATKAGASYIQVGTRAFRYRCRGEDRAGEESEFSLPLLFIPTGVAATQSMANAWAELAGGTATAGGDLQLGGQRVSVAPPPSKQRAQALGVEPPPPDATTIVARAARVKVRTGTFGYQPMVTSLEAGVPALTRFAESSGIASAAVDNLTFDYALAFLKNGLEQASGNAGGALFDLQQLKNATVGLGAAATGGLASPRFDITAYSALLGPVADLGGVASGTFDVRKWLSKAVGGPMNLFGVFPLIDLIPEALELKRAPQIVADAAGQRLTWKAPLFKGGPLPFFEGCALRPGGPQPELRIDSASSVEGGRMRSRTTCEIRQVELVFALAGREIVVVPVNRITFTSIDGGKPAVDVELGQITFGGVLAFVRRLSELIDGLGLAGGPAIDVTPDLVRSTIELPVPSLALGMFALENINFGTTLELPFNSTPSLAFSFATPANRFRLTVSALAGGGYLILRVSTRGIEQLEGAIEFGASVSVNFGEIAKGSVSIMAGIYLRLGAGDAILEGYLRVTGEARVLGLVTLGVELLLGVSYDFNSKVVRARGEIAFSVKCLFFKKTVRAPFSREFSASNGDPTFAQLMAPDDHVGVLPWDQYCAAFAEV